MLQLTTEQSTTMARTARMRARSMREVSAGITGDALEPLRLAWRRRAAELELAAAAFSPQPTLVPTLVRVR